MFATRMIEKNLITNTHLITHKIPCLIVTYAIPRYSLIGSLRKIVNAYVGGFRFHQPVTHNSENNGQPYQKLGVLKKAA
jgi:hypothetical protein